ncbi:MAG: hypothetical protein LIP16_10630 [Clostridium sp.]|nr:hypothetical protein [Clostridium sp.]
MNLFGLDIKSKEEREQEEREYLLRIFPGGPEQKVAVERELRTRLPWADIRSVMLFYVLVRDAMTAKNGPDFETAVEKVKNKQRMIKITPEILAVVRELMGE